MPIINQAFSGFGAENVSGSYDLDFGTLDLVSSVSFFPCKCLTLSPNFGIRVAWINQEFVVNNNNVFFIITDIQNPVLSWPHTSTAFRSDYRAAGIKGGLDFAIPLDCGLAYSGVRMVLLYMDMLI